MAIGLASAGAHVLVNSRTKERATKTVLLIKKLGHSAEAANFDITKDKEVNTFFSKYKNKLNVLVNNAYGNVELTGTIETSRADLFRQSYETSLVASHNLLRSSLSSLRKAVLKDGEASVINISSIYGVVSPDLSLYNSVKTTNPPYYGAAKAALIQFTKYAAIEFGKEKIRVNTITPGPFPTYKTQKKDPSFIRRLYKKIPLGRIGKENELRGPIIFLASNASSYVNGANLVVDGGWTAW